MEPLDKIDLEKIMYAHFDGMFTNLDKTEEIRELDRFSKDKI
jgi:hypothetical protein